jgi:hypothetical protein
MVEKPMNIASEYFILYREIGERSRIYEAHETRQVLERIVQNNPDFTERQDGEMPRAMIVRYVPVDAINH